MTELSEIHKNPLADDVKERDKENGNFNLAYQFSTESQVQRNKNGTADAEVEEEPTELAIWGKKKKREKAKSASSTCKWWRWNIIQGSRTMPGLQRYIEDKPLLQVLVTFLRGCGMFYGLSNPIMGVFSLIAALVNSPFNFFYLTWTVGWSMVWSHVLRAPRELILNGLYPSQGILLGYAVYVTFDPIDLANIPTPDVIAITFAALIPLTAFVIILFQCLANITIKLLGTSPMLMSSLLVSQMWWLMTGWSHHFVNRNLYPAITDPPRRPDFLNVTLQEYCTEVVYGVAMLQFSNSFYCFIPITIGLFLTSPITCATTWIGSVVGIGFTVLFGIEFKHVRLALFGLNSCIVFSCIAGTFFVLNLASFLLAVLSTFSTVYLIMAFKGFWGPTGTIFCAMPATLIVIMTYIACEHVPGLYRVPVPALTCPEDHLKRARLNKILNQFIPFYTKVVVGRNMEYSLRCDVDSVLNRVLLETTIIQRKNDIARKLLKSKMNVRCNGIYVNKHLVHIAIMAGNWEIFQILYNNDNDTIEKQLLTALLYESEQIIDFLVIGGASLQRGDKFVALMLNRFIHKRDVKSLNRWIACGANVDDEDYFGNKPTELAKAINPEAYEVLKHTSLSRKHNIDSIKREFNMTDYFKVKPKSNLNQYEKPSVQCLDVISEIVTEQINTNDDSSDDELLFVLTCLLMQQKTEHIDCIRNENFCYDMKDRLHNTLLHKAAEFDSQNIIKMLIDGGLDGLSINSLGCNPIEVTFMEKQSSLLCYNELIKSISCGANQYPYCVK